MAYWQDKVCLITGASAGLGLAVASALARSGAKVVLNARRSDPLDAAVARLRDGGADAIAVQGDVAWQEDVERIAADFSQRFGKLDLLCNCAGRSTRGAAIDTTPEDFQQLVDANFLTAVRMTRALAPLLIASRGHIVNIGSLASKVATPFLGATPRASSRSQVTRNSSAWNSQSEAFM
jgi:NAD(P)-dependent dehydrogenase (short-subunit alcohol dehydrogenase family)